MDAANYKLLILIAVFCSAVEQPDVVFSMEQIHCAEPHSPAPEDCGTNSDPDSERLVSSTQTQDAADLFFKLKEEPEEAGDDIVPLTGGETDRRHFYLFEHK